jgi:Elongation factor P (EF-P) KOW-like domain
MGGVGVLKETIIIYSTTLVTMFQSLTLKLLLLITVVGAFVPQKSPAFGLTLSVAVDTSEIKNGMTLNIDNEPYKVLSFSIMKQARGAAKTTIKFKNLVRADCVLHGFTHTHACCLTVLFNI